MWSDCIDGSTSTYPLSAWSILIRALYHECMSAYSSAVASRTLEPSMRFGTLTAWPVGTNTVRMSGLKLSAAGTSEGCAFGTAPHVEPARRGDTRMTEDLSDELACHAAIAHPASPPPPRTLR
eukprot:TRINITY_DN9338_c0_g1_i2.p1 TRINITY_DN9338_c0_g1~~TRINITY_DN9338_c0_g1_i2.p1  ORF type:complete len:123 (-),score=0.70 TRINITY_DN9338_c0_g1_i2:6-374(-)